MRISIYRTAHFNAAHRLHVPEWSDAKNLEVFGICSNPNFHGHNYDLEVRISGEVDPVTGYIMNLFDVKRIIKEHVEDQFDHRNLNVDVPAMQGLIPTVENVCYVIWKILREQIDPKLSVGVRLYESPRNYAEYPAVGD